MPERAAVNATRELLLSAATLQGLLTVVIARSETLIKSLEDGQTLYRATEKWTGSETMTEALRDFEERRRQWRLAVMRGWLGEGATITQFAETFGFSRQFAQRLAHEVQAEQEQS